MGVDRFSAVLGDERGARERLVEERACAEALLDATCILIEEIASSFSAAAHEAMTAVEVPLAGLSPEGQFQDEQMAYRVAASLLSGQQYYFWTVTGATRFEPDSNYRCSVSEATALRVQLDRAGMPLTAEPCSPMVLPHSDYWQ